MKTKSNRTTGMGGSAVRRHVGRRIHSLRKRMGLTQEDLADRCDLHWTYIGGLERGERNPTLVSLMRIAEGLETDLYTLTSSRADDTTLTPRQRVEGSILKWLNKHDGQLDGLADRLIREVAQWHEAQKAGRAG